MQFKKINKNLNIIAKFANEFAMSKIVEQPAQRIPWFTIVKIMHQHGAQIPWWTLVTIISKSKLSKCANLKIVRITFKYS